jgi:Fe-S cluster biogenesis protein NfuA
VSAQITEDVTFEVRAAQLDQARRGVERLDDEARVAALALADALEAHQHTVLRTIVSALRADDRGRELLYELVDDAEVYAALVKAGIVRPSLAMRAIQVLDAVRPYLTSHNGDVELVKIEDGVAHVRLLGACQSCGSATSTLRDQVAEALLENLPELHEVREVAPDTAPTTTFIPVTALSFGRKANHA